MRIRLQQAISTENYTLVFPMQQSKTYLIAQMIKYYNHGNTVMLMFEQLTNLFHRLLIKRFQVIIQSINSKEAIFVSFQLQDDSSAEDAISAQLYIYRMPY